MNQQRRNLLQFSVLAGLMASAGLITPAQAAQWNDAAFKARTLDDLLKVLAPESPPEASAQVVLSAPDVADNGAMVPVGVQTLLPATELAILVQKNPSPLAALFRLPQGTEPYVMTRVKMNESSRIYALAKVEGRWLMASKDVMVTLGGCGV